MSTAPHPNVIIPVIHLNGDRAATLIANLTHAYRAVRAAESALYACAGNKRNFYPDPGRWEQYVAQHTRRITLLHALQEELLAEVEGIEAQER